ncbi:cardiolipin synthase [Paenibacillus sp. IB182496]|uniref:Cardiolipin synthase n=1 Tax=Paenibacillus sabuli TaxID=2772509 RepID=A0A927GTI8_9BACL|nr:cardiolipin synthase [Paenibacillus sabuli]MBD2847140.1 cardiolipin synthase [Paenibacillus sabuli]
MIWVVLALLIFIFQIATILIAEFRHPSKAMAWLLILFVFPVIGFVMYYFLARSFQRRRIVRQRRIISEETRLEALRRSRLLHRPEDLGSGEFREQERMFALLQQFSLPITGCNTTQVLNNGETTYASILEAIAAARHHVHVEYYTVRDDRVGRRFQRALLDKLREGAEVRLIYDGIGSYELSAAYVRELEEAGAQVQCFLAPRIAFFDKRINYRNHRKIVVVDGIVGFVGGINVGDEYVGGNKRLGFWRDTHLRIEGDAVYSLQEVFMRDWWFTARERLTDSRYLPEHGCVGEDQVQLVSSGPDAGPDAIVQSVFAALAVAKRRIYITTPYFVPDKGVLMGLKTAAASGVDVRLILPYVADTRLVMLASLSYVEELLLAGARVYRYHKGFIHSKVMIVDGLLGSVGSANMDLRSFYSNFELNALLFDTRTIEELAQTFMDDLDDCHEIRLAEFAARPRLQKAGEIAARMLSPLL